MLFRSHADLPKTAKACSSVPGAARAIPNPDNSKCRASGAPHTSRRITLSSPSTYDTPRVTDSSRTSPASVLRSLSPTLDISDSTTTPQRSRQPEQNTATVFSGYQAHTTTELLIRISPFQRLVREIAHTTWTFLGIPSTSSSSPEQPRTVSRGPQEIRRQPRWPLRRRTSVHSRTARVPLSSLRVSISISDVPQELNLRVPTPPILVRASAFRMLYHPRKPPDLTR